MAEPAYEPAVNQGHIIKATMFSKMMQQAKPGVDISYLEGVQQHPAQQKIHFPAEGDEWRFLVVSGGQRGGKTITPAAEIVHELSQPNRRIWICAPTYDLCDRMFEYVWEWVVRQGVLGRNIESKSKTRDNREIRMGWNSWVRCKSTDNNGESCVGEQLDLVVWDECAPESREIWEGKLFQRLANRQGRGMLISSPRGFNWFKEYYDRGEDPEFRKVGWRSIKFSQLDNPFIDKKEILRQKHTMAESAWEQEVMGNFVHFSGLVYPMFRDELFNPENPSAGGHLFDPKKPPYALKECMHLLSVDIGTRHPTAALWHGVTPNDDVLTWQEYKEVNSSHQYHAKRIRGLSPYPLSLSFISHDAARQDGLSAIPNTPALVYTQEGIAAQPAPRDMQLGISAVSEYMAATLEHNPKHPRWLLSKECVETRKCLQRYVWDSPKRITEKDPPQNVKKYEDDEADALRYGLVSKPRFNRAWMQQAQSKDPMLNELNRYGYRGTQYARKHKNAGKRSGPRVAGFA